MICLYPACSSFSSYSSLLYRETLRITGISFSLSDKAASLSMPMTGKPRKAFLSFSVTRTPRMTRSTAPARSIIRSAYISFCCFLLPVLLPFPHRFSSVLLYKHFEYLLLHLRFCKLDVLPHLKHTFPLIRIPLS